MEDARGLVLKQDPLALTHAWTERPVWIADPVAAARAHAVRLAPLVAVDTAAVVSYHESAVVSFHESAVVPFRERQSCHFMNQVASTR